MVFSDMFQNASYTLWVPMRKTPNHLIGSFVQLFVPAYVLAH